MHVDELTKENFDMYSVWCWDDENEGHVSCGNGEPLPEDQGTLFIKAKFKCQNGVFFDGYLIGIDDFYAFGLFYDENDYIFNKGLDDINNQNLEGLKKKLNDRYFKLFPLEYSSDCFALGGEKIRGKLLF